MITCRVCAKSQIDPFHPCPRCGFLQPAVVGNAEAAEQMIARSVQLAKANFIKGFDFGIIAHYWKDQNGEVVPDHQERLSFGSGQAVLGNTVFLEQQFARIPDVATMELELSILHNGADYCTHKVEIPVPHGKHLQQVGLEMTQDLTVILILKNPEAQTQSEPTVFLN